MGKGDIGKLFPDNDNKYKDISSLVLLEEVANILKESNYKIINIDSVIVMQKPKLITYINEMKKNISKVLNISEELINIKATTEEKLGFTGSGDGVAAKAVCLID